MITDQVLRAIDGRYRAVAGLAAALQAAADEFGLSLREQAAWLAQCAVESAGFTRWEENLHYTRADRLLAVFPSAFASATEAAEVIGQPYRIAARVYAGKLGNGDVASGDGWTYRGRGLIQLTGRANYDRCAQALFGCPVAEMDPDRWLDVDAAARSAAWFWWQAGAGRLLAARGIDAVTRVINGPAMLHADERRAAWMRACEALGVQS